jgi:pimeloyl-ACP methyl ester carboxylesterase
MADALSSGFAHLRKRGVTTRDADAEVDPVAILLCDSIADAFAASLGNLNLSPDVASSGDAFAEGCEDRRTTRGVRYLDRRASGNPMVLVNACGMSASLWSRLLKDRSTPWRLIIPQSPCTDLDQGGMAAAADLSADGVAIAAALDDAGIDRADLLAWCSGARIAVEFAGRFPDRVRSLILVCPTLRGAAGVKPQGSVFEDEIHRIFAEVDGRPNLAPAFAEAFRSLMVFTAWERLAGQPKQRAATLFGLPARERVSALIAPLVRPEFLVNYARRALRDETHQVDVALAKLKMPLLLLTGDDDNRVNNAFTAALFGAWDLRFVHARVKGAGHYLYDLQYPYFRSILSAFLAGTLPARSARVEVEDAAA